MTVATDVEVICGAEARPDPKCDGRSVQASKQRYWFGGWTSISRGVWEDALATRGQVRAAEIPSTLVHFFEEQLGHDEPTTFSVSAWTTTISGREAR